MRANMVERQPLFLRQHVETCRPRELLRHERPRKVEGRVRADDVVNLPRGAGRSGEDRRIFEIVEHVGLTPHAAKSGKITAPNDRPANISAPNAQASWLWLLTLVNIVLAPFCADGL